MPWSLSSALFSNRTHITSCARVHEKQNIKKNYCKYNGMEENTNVECHGNIDSIKRSILCMIDKMHNECSRCGGVWGWRTFACYRSIDVCVSVCVCGLMPNANIDRSGMTRAVITMNHARKFHDVVVPITEHMYRSNNTNNNNSQTVIALRQY